MFTNILTKGFVFVDAEHIYERGCVKNPHLQVVLFRFCLFYDRCLFQF